jgi:hypothetical protein
MSISADLILYNAKVITLDRRRPRAEMVAIKGDRILDIGRAHELEFFKGTKTKILDCEGKTIAPGFNDAHCHPFAFASSLLSVDCSPASVRNIAELQAQIHDKAKQVPKGDWIRAIGYNEFYLAEKRHPTRWDLDKATPYHPVKLTHRSGHACVLSSLALQQVGISLETSEPPGGFIERDLETGEPNGLLLGMNDWVGRAIPPLSKKELERGIRLANQEYLAHGVTSLQDATWGDSLSRWQTFQQLQEEGMLATRVSMMIGIDALEEFQGRGLSTGSGNSRLRLGAVKMVLDEITDLLNPPQAELEQQVLQAHKAGFQVALHVVEESTLGAAITALEHALEQIPKPDHRHRLEHCSVCPPQLAQRLKALQAVVVTQPPFIYYSGERYLETLPPTQLKWLYPIGSWLRNGLKIAASSDSPVVPLNPLIGIYAAVTRAAETGQVLSPNEGVSPLEALQMYTVGAAHASFEERIKGSITPGKLADLVVLSDDPSQASPEEIKEIEVRMTIIGGEVIWEK